MPNKIILFFFWILSKFMKRSTDIWVYGEGSLNSVMPLIKYANGKDKRKHIYITPYENQIKKLANENILALKQSSVLACYYISKAKVHIICKSKLEDVSKYLSHGALIINLFHGIPIKPIGVQNYLIKNKSPNYKTKRKIKKLKDRYSRYVFLCATSPFTQDIFSNCFGINKELLPIVGEPRNDKLFKAKNRHYLESISKKSLKNYNVVFTYMPTWRDYGNWDHQINFNNLNDFLKLNNSVLFVRPHPADKSFTETDKLSNIYFSRSNVDEWSDAYDELVGSDCLISDYSSLVYEFIITGRPILIFTPDYYKYSSKRGLLVGFDSNIPSKCLKTYKDLIYAMSEVINNKYNFYNYEKIQKRYHTYIDNNSSKRVYKHICTLIKNCPQAV